MTCSPSPPRLVPAAAVRGAAPYGCCHCGDREGRDQHDAAGQPRPACCHQSTERLRHSRCVSHPTELPVAARYRCAVTPYPPAIAISAIHFPRRKYPQIHLGHRQARAGAHCPQLEPCTFQQHDAHVWPPAAAAVPNGNGTAAAPTAQPQPARPFVLWRPGWVDKSRAFILSKHFQAAAQLTTGVLRGPASAVSSVFGACLNLRITEHACRT